MTTTIVVWMYVNLSVKELLYEVAIARSCDYACVHECCGEVAADDCDGGVLWGHGFDEREEPKQERQLIVRKVAYT